MYYIIWPEKRFLSENQVFIMYEDASFNGEIENIDCETVDQMFDELNRSGLVTAAASNKEYEHKEDQFRNDDADALASVGWGTDDRFSDDDF
ncbi:MAG: hypothetical protein WD512_19585 [Candidatus Paceibacterota bacterium]